MDLRLPPRGPETVPPLALLQRWQPAARPSPRSSASSVLPAAGATPAWSERLLRWLSPR